MVVPMFSRMLKSPVLIPKIKQAVNSMISHTDFSGMDNLPQNQTLINHRTVAGKQHVSVGTQRRQGLEQ
jgi:hypothetical protein